MYPCLCIDTHRAMVHTLMYSCLCRHPQSNGSLFINLFFFFLNRRFSVLSDLFPLFCYFSLTLFYYSWVRGSDLPLFCVFFCRCRCYIVLCVWYFALLFRFYLYSLTPCLGPFFSQFRFYLYSLTPCFCPFSSAQWRIGVEREYSSYFVFLGG